MLMCPKGQEASPFKKNLEMRNNTWDCAEDCAEQDLGIEVVCERMATGGLLFQRPLHDV